MLGLNAQAWNTPGGIYDRFGGLMEVLANSPNQRLQLEQQQTNKEADRALERERIRIYEQSVLGRPTATKAGDLYDKISHTDPVTGAKTNEMRYKGHDRIHAEQVLMNPHSTPEEIDAADKILSAAHVSMGGDKTRSAPQAAAAPDTGYSYLDALKDTYSGGLPSVTAPSDRPAAAAATDPYRSKLADATDLAKYDAIVNSGNIDAIRAVRAHIDSKTAPASSPMASPIQAAAMPMAPSTNGFPSMGQ